MTLSLLFSAVAKFTKNIGDALLFNIPYIFDYVYSFVDISLNFAEICRQVWVLQHNPKTIIDY